MLVLTAKHATTTWIGPDTVIKMMALNDGEAVSIWLDGKTVTVPIREYYEKVKATFFTELTVANSSDGS